MSSPFGGSREKSRERRRGYEERARSRGSLRLP